ncbi:MAG: hypothetical protein Q9191_003194 [Dirinaria sp. TL-2023a]
MSETHPTPEAVESPQAKPTADKDRECPFCNTRFTSSSLGRHLDLYIREKNPKAPDGVHDVEEIRKLRGNVTRRQARTASTKREDSTPASSKPTSLRDQRSPSASATAASRSQRNGGALKTITQKPCWTSTGVINDLPAEVQDGSPAPNSKKNPSRRTSVKEELSRKEVALAEKDRARAAEYALKEVLASVKAANMRAHPQSPFDFNLFNLSFPAICLRCLSVPPSLSFGSTFSRERSWSIDPPTVYHLEALRRWLSTKIRDWRIRRKALGMVRATEHEATNGHDDQAPAWSMVDPEADEHEAACTQYLNDVFQSWQNLSELQKHERWHSECVTALTHEQDRHRDTRDRMERLEREVQSLQAELNERNFNEAPSTFPLSHQTALQTFDSATDLAAWDYDKLITKWRTRIQLDRAQQRPLPAPPTPKTASILQSALSPSYTNNTGVYHQMQQQMRVEQKKNEADDLDEDEDLVDAPGEEDDTEPTPLMHRDHPLDPNLKEKPTETQDTMMGNNGPNGISQAHSLR